MLNPIQYIGGSCQCGNERYYIHEKNLSSEYEIIRHGHTGID